MVFIVECLSGNPVKDLMLLLTLKELKICDLTIKQ